MRTIFIYGTPGVGKLTVAKELSKLTGFSLLHNHLLNDLVMTIFEFGTKEYTQAVHEYRLNLMERATMAKQKGIILTFVYAQSTDNPYLNKIVRQARKHGGKILFVHLICDRGELLKRIKHPARRAFHKIKTHKKIHSIMRKYDLLAEVSQEPNFIIDNTNLSPNRVAKLIQKHYRL